MGSPGEEKGGGRLQAQGAWAESTGMKAPHLSLRCQMPDVFPGTGRPIVTGQEEQICWQFT